ncbi:MAG: phosphohydrolase, partial [Bacteroidales bacterium]|nr:phosphohydrolase [Bacteroidales bacterium]
PSKERIQSDLKNIAERFGISMEEAKYFTINCDVSSNIYDNSDYDIEILYNDGSIRPITEASDILNIDVLSKKVKKHAYAYIR